MKKLPKNDEEWKKKLTPEQYLVLREKGTESAFTGKYWNTKDKGMYHCVGCGAKLFSSDTKFDSGTGWPSFDKSLPGTVNFISDNNLGIQRTEVVCAKCKSHLGHIFNDGPTKTGKRYCINSCSINLENKS
ncbi:peptide-methionine (R)-S-oxide reductase MsrB [Candidatus Pacearchaeota archaeon]|nr:peptide-methionine (R)-S-oxide reductase MsrB [Candidatus Pacearchaeota archaeon]